MFKYGVEKAKYTLFFEKYRAEKEKYGSEILIFSTEILFSSSEKQKYRVEKRKYKVKREKSVMSRVTFAQSLTDARLMSDALKAHGEELAKVGLDVEASEKLTALIAKMGEKDTEQEKLKTDLKKTTAALNAMSAELSVLMSDCKKRVKLAMKKDVWKEFGIQDKQ